MAINGDNIVRFLFISLSILHLQTSAIVLPSETDSEFNLSEYKTCANHGDGNLEYCSCNEICLLYDDCCIDLANKTIPKDILNLKERISDNAQCMGIENLGESSPWYTINRCPPAWNSSIQTKTLCEQVPAFHPGPETDQMQYIPVVGDSTGLLYRNIYCSICHDENNVTYWTARFACGEMEIIDAMNLKEEKISATLDRCWPVYSPPKGVKMNSKHCIPHAASCADHSSIHRTQCENESYVSYVSSENTREIFKDVSCALCNGLSAKNISLELALPKEQVDSLAEEKWKVTGSSYSLSILFDPNALRFVKEVQNEEKVIQFTRCLPGEVFDVVTVSCRQLECSEGYYLNNEGECLKEHIEVPRVLVKKLDPDSDTNVILMDQRVSPATTIASSLNMSLFVDGVIHHSFTKWYRNASRCQNYTDFMLLSNGSLYLNKTGETVPRGQFSVLEDKIVELCWRHPPRTPSREYEERILMVFSFSEAQQILSLLGSILSIVCLAALLTVYTALPTLRNVPGKLLMNLAGALFMAQLLFLLGPAAGDVDVLCTAIAVGMHYAFLVAFFWMNVMSFDVYRTFSRLTVQAMSNARYPRYVYYAWSAPVPLVLTAFIFDFFPVPYMAPGYGDHGVCWITQSIGLIAYFAAPVGVLLLANIVFFSLAVQNILRATKAASMAIMVEKSTNKRCLLLYTKLSTIVGITWVMAFVAMATKLRALWYVFIILNTLQGVFIFVAFVCNRRVWRLLKKKLGRMVMQKYEMPETVSNSRSSRPSSFRCNKGGVERERTTETNFI